MTFNGSGTFIRTDGVRSGDNVCQQQAEADVVISPTLFDIELNNIATALSQCVTKNGETGGFTAPISAGGQRITSLLTPLARTDAANFAAVQNQTCNWANNTTGTGGAYAAGVVPIPSNSPNLSAGLIVRCRINHTRSGSLSMTLDLNGTGAKTITPPAGFGLVQNDLVTFMFDGTNFLILSIERQPLSFTPNIEVIGGAGGSLDTNSVKYARYQYSQRFKGIEIELAFSCETSTGFTKDILFSLPVAAESGVDPTWTYNTLHGSMRSASSVPSIALVQAFLFSPTQASLRMPNQTTGKTNFPSSASINFHVHGFYSTE